MLFPSDKRARSRSRPNKQELHMTHRFGILLHLHSLTDIMKSFVTLFIHQQLLSAYQQDTFATLKLLEIELGMNFLF